MACDLYEKCCDLHKSVATWMFDRYFPFHDVCSIKLLVVSSEKQKNSAKQKTQKVGDSGKTVVQHNSIHAMLQTL